MDSIVINDRDYSEILVVVGHPYTDITQWGITKDNVLELAILPAVREFYKWFPKPLKEQYSISGSFEYAFPNESVFDVEDSRLSTVIGSVLSSLGSPFVDNINITQRSGGYNRMYGTDYDYGMTSAFRSERSSRQAELTSQMAFKVDVNYSARTITGYTNTVGQLSITWACYDEIFDSIPYKFKQDVINLCKSKLLRNISLVMSMMVADVPNQFNYADLIDESDALEDKVMTKWRAYGKPVILRN